MSMDMGEILIIFFTGAVGYYWWFNKYKKEKSWEQKNEFYSNIQQWIDRAEVALGVNQCSGGICDLGDYDRIYECVSEMRSIIATSRIFLKSDAITCVEDLIKSLCDGMIWYRESFGDGNPFEAVTHMKDSTEKAKKILTNLGRRDLAV